MSTKLTITIDEDLKRRARARAILGGQTLSSVIRELLGRWLAGEITIEEVEAEKEKEE